MKNINLCKTKAIIITQDSTQKCKPINHSWKKEFDLVKEQLVGVKMTNISCKLLKNLFKLNN